MKTTTSFFLSLILLPAAALAQEPIAWSAGPALAIPRDHHAVFTVQASGSTWLYVAGGTNYRESFDDVSRAEIRRDGSLGDWRTTTPLPTPLAGGNAVAVGDVVVFIGGQTHGGQRMSARVPDVYIARVAADGSIGDWVAAAPLPAPRFHHPTVAHEGRVYVVGGQGTREAETGVYVARIDGDGSIREWIETTPLPRPRSHHAAFVMHGHVYVFGGLDGAAGGHQAGFFDVMRAPIQADGMLGAWETVSMIPHSYATHAVALHDGTLRLLGGVEDLARFSSAIWQTTVDAEGGMGEWTAVEPGLPIARGHVHVTPVVNGRVYSIGGRIVSADGRPAVTGDVHIGALP